MVYYVSHQYLYSKENIEKAKEIVGDLQRNDLENVYVCPLLLFGHLNGEIAFNDEIELRKDIFSVCDKLIVASDIDQIVDAEIEFAHLIGMEVEYPEPQDT